LHTFSTAQRDRSMTATVSYHGVPLFRGLAFALHHIAMHGGGVWVYSADRRDHVIAEHNRQFGTHLHGQQWLVDAHAHDPVRNAPANSPTTTSHCLRSDGAPVYRDARGRHVPAGGSIPWYSLGIDLEDADSDGRRGNDVDRFLRIAHRLGYAAVRPYASGSEGHHVVFVHSPIPTLEHWNQIAKERHE
jgi:hypothetical protein